MTSEINDSGAFNAQEMYGNKNLKEIQNEGPTTNERLLGIKSIFAIETVEEVEGVSNTIASCLDR